MLIKNFIFIFMGLKYTIIVTCIVISISLYAGLYIGIVRFINKSRIISAIVESYVSFFRFTPLIFQFTLAISLFIKYINLSVLCVIILSLNSIAYVSNIIIDSLNGISINAWQTLQGLNISAYQGIKIFLMPSILRSSFHNLQNEIINITKESSLIGVIGMSDIFFRCREVGFKTFDFISPLLFAGCLYFILNYLQERFLSKYIIKSFVNLISSK